MSRACARARLAASHLFICREALARGAPQSACTCIATKLLRARIVSKILDAAWSLRLPAPDTRRTRALRRAQIARPFLRGIRAQLRNQSPPARCVVQPSCARCAASDGFPATSAKPPRGHAACFCPRVIHHVIHHVIHVRYVWTDRLHRAQTTSRVMRVHAQKSRARTFFFGRVAGDHGRRTRGPLVASRLRLNDGETASSFLWLCTAREFRVKRA
jgi:hypothetical protein